MAGVEAKLGKRGPFIDRHGVRQQRTDTRPGAVRADDDVERLRDATGPDQMAAHLLRRDGFHLAVPAHRAGHERIEQQPAQGRPVDLRPAIVLAVMVEQQRAARIVKPVALILGPRFGHECLFQPSQPQRVQTRFFV